MDWNLVGKKLAKHGLNLLGSAVPGASFVTSLVADILGCDDNPTSVDTALNNASPDKIIELKKLQIANKTDLQKIILGNETKRIEAVNETMRAEAKSEHWMQWAWRPFNGFAFGITLFCNYSVPTLINCLVFPWFDKIPESLTSGHIPPEVFMSWGAILGVSAWHRGKEKIERSKLNT